MGHYTSKSKELNKIHNLPAMTQESESKSQEKKKEVSNIELQLAFSNYTIAICMFLMLWGKHNFGKGCAVSTCFHVPANPTRIFKI